MQSRVKSIKLKIISNKKKSLSLYISWGLVVIFILFMFLPMNKLNNYHGGELIYLIIFLIVIFAFYVLRSMPSFKTLGYIKLRTDNIHLSIQNKTINLSQINKIILFGEDSGYTNYRTGIQSGGNKNILTIYSNQKLIFCERIFFSEEKELTCFLLLMEQYQEAGINFKQDKYKNRKMIWDGNKRGNTRS